MPAARYWRLSGITTRGGQTLDLSQLELWAGGAKLSATLSCPVTPLSGSLANLSDADLGTAASWTLCPGLVFNFDLGSSLSVDGPKFGSVGLSGFPESVMLEYSADSITWITFTTYNRVIYPGASALTSIDPITESAVITQSLIGIGTTTNVLPPDFATTDIAAQIMPGLGVGGTSRITGTVKVTPATPVARKVRLYRELDGHLMAQTWSNATTGEYSFDNIPPGFAYTVLSYDHTELYRAVVADRLLSEPMP